MTNLSISASWVVSILRFSTAQVNLHGACCTIAEDETTDRPDSCVYLCAIVHSGPGFTAGESALRDRMTGVGNKTRQKLCHGRGIHMDCPTTEDILFVFDN